MQIKKIKIWGYHVVVAIDQLFNALIGGAADETLSSRTYRGAMLAPKAICIADKVFLITLFTGGRNAFTDLLPCDH